jgi:serine/threonine-protein kinase/endoribonuclease IRE1
MTAIRQHKSGRCGGQIHHPNGHVQSRTLTRTMLHTLFLPLSLLAVLFVFTTAALSDSVTVRRDIGVREKGVNDLHFLPPRGHSTTDDDPLEILNVVLVASVDGKFHALNRTTGGKLWSMPSSPPPRASPSSSDPEPVQPVPSILGPLVSTKHLDVDPDIDDDPFSQETYIVEPQSGDIYVTTSNSPTAPLQRLPFSMSQLVDMSPFSFGEADGRVFVGRKKTSVLLLELETGRVKAVLDSECPWDGRNDTTDTAEQDVMDVDLDELEGLKSFKRRPHEVLIGRTGAQTLLFPSSICSDCQVKKIITSRYSHIHLPVLHDPFRFSICRSPHMVQITKIFSDRPRISAA